MTHKEMAAQIALGTLDPIPLSDEDFAVYSEIMRTNRTEREFNDFIERIHYTRVIHKTRIRNHQEVQAQLQQLQQLKQIHQAVPGAIGIPTVPVPPAPAALPSTWITTSRPLKQTKGYNI